MTAPSDKIMTLDQAAAWSERLQQDGLRLVVTNGVFDLLHRGHAQYLHEAAACGDRLLVAINSDAAVRQLKGPTRPVVGQDDRAYMLASLECVSAVVIFEATKPTDVFRRVRLAVYAKGGDYTEDTLDREEHAILKAQSPRFVFLPFVSGFSTSSTIRQIRGGEATAPAGETDHRLDLLFARRSVRAFQPRPVGDDLLRRLLEAAMAAPSAGAKDPWQFIVLKDAQTRTDIAAFLPNGGFLAKAPAGIVVCGDLARAHGHELSYLLQDVSAACENLLLAATALSLGACWLGIHPRQDRVDNISRRLGLPEGVIPVAGVALGYPAQDPLPRTRAKDDRIHWNRF